MSFDKVLLGNVCEITMGQAPSGDSYNNEDVGLPLIAGAGDFGDRTPEPSKYTTSPTKVSRPNEIILCIRATIGDRNWSDAEYCLGRGVAGLLGKKGKLDQNFLWHWIEYASPDLKAKGRGATFLQVSKADIASLEIALPSLPEQRRIAAILDKADSLRVKRCEAIAKLDQLLQSVFLDMFGDPLANPKGWVTYRLEEFIKFTGGSQPPKSVFSDVPKSGYVRLVQIRDFRTSKYVTYIPENLARRRFSKDDVMIGRYGPPVFQIFRGLEGSYNVALMKAEPKEKVLREYLFHLLRSDSIQASVIANSERSAGQSGVNLDFLHGVEIGLPPIDLQAKFASIAQSLIAQRELHVNSELHAGQFFSSLQYRAFQGSL